MKLVRSLKLFITYFLIGITWTGHSQSFDPVFNPRILQPSSSTLVSAQSDGKVYVSGNHDFVEGIFRKGLIRLNAEGSLDNSFDFSGVEFEGNFRSLIFQPDGKMILAGPALTSSGFSHGVIRISPDGTVDPEFDPTIGFNATVWEAALLENGNILVVGQFSQFNGAATSNVIRLLPNGSLDETFSHQQVIDNIVALVVQSDGKIVIGGNDNNGDVRVERLNTDGSLDESFLYEPDFTGLTILPPLTVFNLEKDSNDQIFIIFFGALGDDLFLILDKDGNTIASTEIAANNVDIEINSQDQVFLAGIPSFDNINRIYEWNGFLSTISLPFSKRTRDLEVDGNDNLYATSLIESNGEIYGPYKLDVQGQLDTGFRPDLKFSPNVDDFLVQGDGKIIVSVTNNDLPQPIEVNGSIVNSGLFRLNSDGTLDQSFNANISPVAGMELQADGKIIVNSDQGLTRLLEDGSIDQSFNITLTDNLSFMDVVLQPDGKIWGIGQNVIGGSTAVGALRFESNGDLDEELSDRLGPTIIHILPQPDGKQILFGFEIPYDGTVAGDIFRINADNSVDTQFQYEEDIVVSFRDDVALQSDGKILISGFNSNNESGIFRLNADGSLDSSFEIGIVEGGGRRIQDINILSNGNIVLGGDFTSFNGIDLVAPVLQSEDGELMEDFQVANLPGFANKTIQLNDDEILIGGIFVGGENSQYTSLARIDVDIETPTSPMVTGLNFKDISDEITLFPNPVTSNLQIQVGNQSMGSTAVYVYDMSGKIEHSQSFKIGPTRNELSVDLTHLKKGLHLLEVRQGAEFRGFKRIVKN